MTDTIVKWSSKNFLLSDLKPYGQNPRKISDTAYQKLKESLVQDGYHCRLIATQEGLVIGGHMRLRALKDIGVNEVEVLVPDRALTDDEFKRIMVRDNLPYGEFDWDILANEFDVLELIDLGMPEEWLPDIRGLEAAPAESNSEKPPLVCPICGHVFGSEGKQ